MRKILSFCCLLGLSWLMSDSVMAGDEEFLQVDEAFRISAQAVDAKKVRVRWQIADGYYLYKSKFRFRSHTPGIEAGAALLPEAEVKHDPNFGEVDVYHRQVAVDLTLGRQTIEPVTLSLEAKIQGCAEAGLCYPPHVQQVLIPLPPMPAEKPQPVDRAEMGKQANKPLRGMNALLDIGAREPEAEIPSVEKAFRLQAEVVSPDRLRLQWQVAPGTYLYQEAIKILPKEADNRPPPVSLGAIDWPKAKIKHNSIRPDEEIGDVAVYDQDFSVEVPLVRAVSEPGALELVVKYQGCAEVGVCYPPQQQNIRLDLPAFDKKEREAEITGEENNRSLTQGREVLNEQDQLLSKLTSASPFFALLLSLVFGVLVAFTACMYPMIPILTSLIVGQSEKITTTRAFSLSLAYTQGIAVTFGVLGGIMAAVGKELGIQGALQTPWVLVPSALLFVLLALSMFGFYQIQVPAALQSRLNEMSNKQQGGSLIGVGLMGVLSALIVGPCGGPVLLAVLAFAAQSQYIPLGFLYLWIFGTGMGLPLLLMGAGGGALLPRAGIWMDTVKAIGGVIMLALAISFLERLAPTSIPYALIMLMWGVLMIVVAVYMGALRNLSMEASGWSKLWKGLGLALLVYGSLMLVGVAAGGKDSLQPLRGLGLGGGTASMEVTHLSFQRIKTSADLQRELKAAQAKGQPVMLDFYADWCTYCKKYEKYVFTDPKVQATLKGMHLIQADVTASDDQDKALMAELGIPAPPAILFWGKDGQEQRNYRLMGYKDAAQFEAHVRKLLP